MASSNFFTLSEVFSYGWNTFKKNWQLLVIVTVIYWIAGLIPDWLQLAVKDSAPVAVHFIGVIRLIILLVLQIGGIVIALKIVDHKKPQIEDLYNNYPILLNYFLVMFILAVMVSVGLILFIVPGVYLLLRFYYAANLVVDKNLGPLQALQKSSKLTEGIRLKLLGLGLSSLAIIVLGWITVIGVVVAYPVVFLANMYVYRKLVPHHAE